MKKVLKVLSVIIALIVVWLGYMGMFNSVEVVDGPEGGYELAGVWHHGSYGMIGETFQELVDMADESGLEDYKMMSIYFNKPGDVPDDSLLTFVGVILTDSIPDSEGWDNITLPKREAVYSDFVYRNMMSYGFGAVKCFPKLMEETKSKGWENVIGCEYYEGHEYTRYILMNGNVDELR